MESNVGEVVAKGGELVYKVVQPEGGGSKIENTKIGNFKMLPKMVVLLVLSTSEHQQLGLILQKVPRALYFNFWECKSGVCYFISSRSAKFECPGHICPKPPNRLLKEHFLLTPL